MINAYYNDGNGSAWIQRLFNNLKKPRIWLAIQFYIFLDFYLLIQLKWNNQTVWLAIKNKELGIKVY